MVVTKQYIECLFFLAALFSVFSGYAQDNLLKRKVTIDVREKPLENVLLETSDLAKFTFSYNATILPSDKTISLHTKEASVKTILDKILSEDIEYKVSGNHLILLKKLPVDNAARKEKYTISGNVRHAANKMPLSNIVIYEVSSLISAVTDEKGGFSISVPAQFTQLGLSFNNKTFNDTIIFIAPKDQVITISLVPAHIPPPAEKIESLPIRQPSPVESLPLVQQLVPSQLFVRTQNMDLIRERKAQISFFPTLGTNLKMSGLIENKFSINVLAGYAHSVSAFEMGGLFNIIRKDVNGFQIAGLGNMVGRNIRGIQVAGLFNHVRGSFDGAQVGGITNMILDTLQGIQVAGINNILKGGMKGWQIAGINNTTTENVDGVQMAGIFNIAGENVKMLQIAGHANIGKRVNGIQVAGLLNYAVEDVQGFQLAGIVNKAKNTDGLQVAGIANITTGKVSGVQLSGVVNYAEHTEGVQISLFNLADSASGTPIGLLSFVKKGFREVELSSNEITPGNIAFKTGVKRFYNIFSGGLGSWSGERRWRFGYGVGTERALNQQFALNFEYTASWVSENQNLQKDLSLLNRLDINLIYNRTNKISFSAGPSINFLLSEWKDPETGEYLTGLSPYTIIDTAIGSSLAQVWIGGKVAIYW